MNVENILKVADAIEQHSIPDLGFNMAVWHGQAADSRPDMSGHSCGTVACIVGWAEAVCDGSGLYGRWMRGELERYFGIDDRESDELAFPAGFEENIYTPAQAVRTLRHLAATGEVRWDLPEPAEA